MFIQNKREINKKKQSNQIRKFYAKKRKWKTNLKTENKMFHLSITFFAQQSGIIMRKFRAKKKKKK